MCDPITAILGLVGGVVQGIGAAQQVQQQQLQADMQAKAQERQAEGARMEGGYNYARKGDEMKRLQGAQRAAFSANGIDQDAGSAGDVQYDADKEMTRERTLIATNAQNEALNHMIDAKNTRDSAPKNSSVALAFVGPVIRTASSFIA
jgi:hypothetical protein